MLQPAPARPETGPSTVATYGELMSRAIDAASTAIAVASTDDRPVLAGELSDYEHFLHLTGVHARLLGVLTRPHSQALRALVQRLKGSPARAFDHADHRGPWVEAAFELGIAHDVLATHVGPDRDLRTPEIAEIIGSGQGEMAATRLATLTLDTVAVGRHLIARSRTARAEDPSWNDRRLAQLTSRLTWISICAKGALWDLALAATEPADIDALTPAPCVHRVNAPIRSNLEALRILRQVSHSQARGFARGSAASIRDLTLLGARVTDPDAAWPAKHSSGLDRLKLAHLQDALEAAHEAWRDAGQGLTTHIRGVTAAPAAYRDAVTYLLRAEPLSQPVRNAVTSAMPSLARNAVLTVEELYATNGLARGRREPGKCQIRWTPLIWLATPRSAPAS